MLQRQNPFELVRARLRNSPWLVISVAAHTIALAVLAAWYLHAPQQQTEEPPTIVMLRPHELPPEPPPPEEPPIVRNLIPDQPSVFVDIDTVDPTITFDAPLPDDPTVDIGRPDGDDNPLALSNASTPIGPGIHGGIHGPPTTRSTHGPVRPGGNGPKGTLTGQTPMERAVLDGLCWLARHQNSDGSWSASKLHERCDPDHFCGVDKLSYLALYDEGLTGMSLLAFLGAGISVDSKQFIVDPIGGKRYACREVVKQGLMWLKNHQQSDGSFSTGRPFLYNDALATMALAENLWLTRNSFWRSCAQRGVDFLVAAQRPSPTGQGQWGWRYDSFANVLDKNRGGSLDEAGKKELFDADTSVTGWAVMALKSAQLAGLEVKAESMQGALAFTKWVSTPDGQAGYLDPKSAGAMVSGPEDQYTYHPTTMTALSMCIRTFGEHDISDPYLEPAAKRLAADLPKLSADRLSIDYYYWYYGSLALNQYDGPDSPKKNGKYWLPWKKAMEQTLLALQDHSPNNCGHGGWLVPDRWSHSGGPLYSTALNVLTLEVYYRFENAFGAKHAAQQH